MMNGLHEKNNLIYATLFAVAATSSLMSMELPPEISIKSKSHGTHKSKSHGTHKSKSHGTHKSKSRGAQQATTNHCEFLQKHIIQNPINPIRSFYDAKQFAGHVVAYKRVDRDHSRISRDALSKYGFIHEKICLSRSCVGYELSEFSGISLGALPSCFGYELYQFSNPDYPIQIRFSCDNGYDPHKDHSFTDHECINTDNIFVRYLTPQEAAVLVEDVKQYQQKEKYSYLSIVLARLKYRAQQEDNEEPNLSVICTKKNMAKILSLTPQQAHEYLNSIKSGESCFDYYVSKAEQLFIEDLLESVITEKQILDGDNQ